MVWVDSAFSSRPIPLLAGIVSTYRWSAKVLALFGRWTIPPAAWRSEIVLVHISGPACPVCREAGGEWILRVAETDFTARWVAYSCSVAGGLFVSPAPPVWQAVADLIAAWAA